MKIDEITQQILLARKTSTSKKKKKITVDTFDTKDDYSHASNTGIGTITAMMCSK